LSALRSF
jgi:3-deoxy-7-phosphoheptulonate synthase